MPLGFHRPIARCQWPLRKRRIVTVSCSLKRRLQSTGSSQAQPSQMAVLAETPQLPQLNFHPGEVTVQELVGVREHVVSSGYNAFIRSYMPEQHRDFFSNQKLFYISARDAMGQVWVSVLPGRPGFVSSPDARHLLISPVTLHPEDPVTSCLKKGAHLGAVGLEYPTRRRNRVNVTVLDINNASAGVTDMASGSAALSMLTKVELSYGNCPKYIQAREIEIDYDQLSASSRTVPPLAERGGAHLGPVQQQLVRAADTIFVGSCYDGPVPNGTNPDTVGCDCSHRGGPPGFVQVTADAKGTQPTKLTWADYRGNMFYQTMGNLMLNPAAGLLIVDFKTGDTLQITGRASVQLHDTSLPGALHSISLEVTSFVHTHNALPLKQVGATAFSPFLPGPMPTQGTNTDPTTAATAAAEAAASSTAEAIKLVSVTQAAHDIKTFELKVPAQGWDAQPGQYASFEFTPGALKAPQPPSAPSGLGNSQGEVTSNKDVASSNSSNKAVASSNSNNTHAGQSSSIKGTSIAADGGGSAMLRTWTISSHPDYSAHNNTFTITVKKVGVVTTWMHEHLKPGMEMHLRAVGGEYGPDLYFKSPPAKALAASSAAQVATPAEPAKALAGSSFAQGVTGTDASMRSNSTAGSQATPVEGALLLAGGIGITPMWPILHELTQPCATKRSNSSAAQPGNKCRSTPGLPPAFIVLVYSVRTLQDAALLPQIASVLENQQQWQQYEQSESQTVTQSEGSPADPNTPPQTLERANTCGSLMQPYVRVVLSVTGKVAEAGLEGTVDPSVLKNIHVYKGRVSQQLLDEHIQAASSMAAALESPSKPASTSAAETYSALPNNAAAEGQLSASSSSAPFDSIRAAYACGPPGFMASVEALLGAPQLGFDINKRLHTESFNF